MRHHVAPHAQHQHEGRCGLAHHHMVDPLWACPGRGRLGGRLCAAGHCAHSCHGQTSAPHAGAGGAHDHTVAHVHRDGDHRLGPGAHNPDARVGSAQPRRGMGGDYVGRYRHGGGVAGHWRWGAATSTQAAGGNRGESPGTSVGLVGVALNDTGHWIYDPGAVCRLLGDDAQRSENRLGGKVLLTWGCIIEGMPAFRQALTT